MGPGRAVPGTLSGQKKKPEDAFKTPTEGSAPRASARIVRQNGGFVKFRHRVAQKLPLQDVTEIIRQNKEAQNAQKCGFQKASTFRRVASIPVAVADIAAAQGLDILNDPEAMRKFLNDPDNRAFRARPESV